VSKCSNNPIHLRRVDRRGQAKKGRKEGRKKERRKERKKGNLGQHKVDNIQISNQLMMFIAEEFFYEVGSTRRKKIALI
jgi:hypothetical protein